MKKALALSTIFTSLALPLCAQVPQAGTCYERSYDAAHLAAHPDQGVAALRLWFFDEIADAADRRAVIVAAVMADQGQGARDLVGGMELRQFALCSAEACFVECDGGSFAATARPPAGLEIATEGFSLGMANACGGSSDLWEGRRTVYRLSAAAPEVCADLARVHAFPHPGCYGVEYAGSDAGQGVVKLRLRLQGEEVPGLAYPGVSGWLGVELAHSDAAEAVGMAGARLSVPLWCSGFDGLCRSGAEEGVLNLDAEGNLAVIGTQHFVLFGPEDAMLDLAAMGPVRHRLRPLPAPNCVGLE